MKYLLPIIFSWFTLNPIFCQIDTAQVNSLNRLSEQYVRNDSGIVYAQEAFELAKKLNYLQGQADAFEKMGNCYHYLSKPDSAVKNYEQAVMIYEKIRPQDSLIELSIVRCLFNAAYTLRLQGKDWAAVFDNYEKSLKIARKINNWEWIANNLAHMGAANASQGNYKPAQDLFLEALQIRKNIQYKRGVGECMTLLSDLYMNQKLYAKARENYFGIIPIFQELNNLSGICTVYLGIGQSYLQEKNYQEALKNYQEAYKIAEVNKIQPLLRNSLKALAEWYEEQKNYPFALEYYQKALQVQREKATNKSSAARILGSIGEVYYKMKDYQNAKIYFQQSLDTALALQFKAEISRNYLRFADLYQATAEYILAHTFLRQHLKIKEELDRKAFEKEVLQYSARYEWDKQQEQMKKLRIENELKEAESKLKGYISYFSISFLILIGSFAIYFYKNNKKISRLNRILRIKNEDIQEKNEELAVMNDQRNKLFSVIAHDLRNSLYGFRSYVQKIEMIEPQNQPTSNKTASQLNESVTNILTFLETLLEWATNQLNQNLHRIHIFNLHETAEKSLSFYQNTYLGKNIEVKNQIFPSQFIAANPDLVQMVLRNLLSNALKYTPENGSISIESLEDEEFWELVVSDTGIGISTDRLNTLFVQTVNPHDTKDLGEEIESKGLGLWLCQDSVSQLGGRIWATSEVGKGSHFHFTIPKKPKKHREK